MDARVQSQYDALTAALDALIDSITSYNPSPAAAQALVSENASLDASLETLATHQRNYATLVELRAQAQGLDDRIRQTLTLLADTRHDLLAAAPPEPIDAVAEPAPSSKSLQGVDYQLLLSTAQRIAKYTVPPTYRSAMQEPVKAEIGSEGLPGDLSTTLQTTDQSSGAQGPGVDVASAMASGYTPWPSQEMIWRGAFGRVQALSEDATQPAGEEAVRGKLGGMPEGANGRQAEVETHKQDPVRRPTIVESARALDAEEAAKRRRDQERMFGEFELYNPDEE